MRVRPVDRCEEYAVVVLLRYSACVCRLVTADGAEGVRSDARWLVALVAGPRHADSWRVGEWLHQVYQLKQMGYRGHSGACENVWGSRDD